jgi:hypothetical protein
VPEDFMSPFSCPRFYLVETVQWQLRQEDEFGFKKALTQSFFIHLVTLHIGCL